MAETPYSANERRGQWSGVLTRASEVFRSFVFGFSCLERSKQGTPFDFEPNIARRRVQARNDHKFLARQGHAGADVSQRLVTAFF
ncbi:hypothetical protein [Maricaulis maris]|uniref:hypothetical protein n=1 Tax=Maricaulis maris TaxID=74318 RepID=UPI000EB5472B|nr:hypothetical protein [Maricaulis maris]